MSRIISSTTITFFASFAPVILCNFGTRLHVSLIFLLFFYVFFTHMI